MKYLTICLSLLLLSACSNTDRMMKKIIKMTTPKDTIAMGLKEALENGTTQAVNKLAAEGGYKSNVMYRITSPAKLQNFTKQLRRFGLSSQVEKFENKMNEAAELAASQATPILLDAIHNMTLEDSKKILMGPDNAATEYFRKRTSERLKREYMEIIRKKMSEIKLVGYFNSLIQKYNALAFSKPINIDLESYVTDEALKGLFSIIEKTEKDIRENPMARTSDLLKKVFSQQDPLPVKKTK